MRLAPRLGAAAAAALLALGPAGAEAATYGYARLAVANVAFEGPDGAAVLGAGTFSSNLLVDGAPVLSTYDEGTLGGGADAGQAARGAGPFPAENAFGAALASGAGARADSRLVGPALSGGAAEAVAEGRLAGPPANVSLRADAGIFLRLVLTATATFAVSFDAAAELLAATDGRGEAAAAATIVAVTAFRLEDATEAAFVPDALNRRVASAEGAPAAPYAFAGRVATGPLSLGPGTYDLRLDASAVAFLDDAGPATPPPIPLPAGAALLLLGLVALPFARGRRER